MDTLVFQLAKACTEVKYEEVKQCLLNPNFEVDDKIYKYVLPSAHWPGLVMNASAFILCSAIAGRSRGIVKLLMYESLDPSAMNSLPLRCALLYGDPEIISLIGNRTPGCPEKYLGGPRIRHLFELSQAELEDYAITREMPSDVTETALTVVQSPDDSFRKALTGAMLSPEEANMVPNTPLHHALYWGLLRTGKIEFRVELYAACTLRERQLPVYGPMARV